MAIDSLHPVDIIEIETMAIRAVTAVDGMKGTGDMNTTEGIITTRTISDLMSILRVVGHEIDSMTLTHGADPYHQCRISLLRRHPDRILDLVLAPMA